MKKLRFLLWPVILLLTAGIVLILAQLFMGSRNSAPDKHISETLEIPETPTPIKSSPAGPEASQHPQSSADKAVPQDKGKNPHGSNDKPVPPTGIDPEAPGLNPELMQWIEKGIDLAEKKQYLEALRALDKALEICPESKPARKLASQINCAMGQKSFSEKDYARAEELFNEVIYYQPGDPCGLLGLALCAYKKDVDMKTARQILEQYLEAGGDEAIAYQTLGEIYYHGNDLEKAALYLEKALSREPRNQKVSMLLKRIQRERRVEQDFTTDDSRHFMVKYEGLENTAAGFLVLTQLEEARVVVGQVLDYYPEIPITAILYTNEQFQDVTQSPAWANAIFDGKIRLPAKGLAEDKVGMEKTRLLKRILFHEYTHALIFEYTRGNKVPVWLHEGLAQNSEGRVSEHAEDIFRIFAKADKIIPLRYLEDSFLGLSAVEAAIAYAESLAAVQYVKKEYGEYALRDLLDEIRDGATMEQAIRAVFYCSYEKFDKRFLNWLNHHYE